jgi:hypothetical protein
MPRSTSLTQAKAVANKMANWRPNIDHSSINDILQRRTMRTEYDLDCIMKYYKQLTP